MRLAVYDDFRLGVVEDDLLRDITGLLPDGLDLLPELRMSWLIGRWAELAVPVAEHAGPRIPLADVRLRACSPAPRHVFALPGNYREHLGEIGAMTVSGKRTANEMGFFLKAPGSVTGPADPIALPAGSQRRFDHESELAVIIGTAARDVSAADAPGFVFGYTCAVDATMRIDPDGRQEDRSMRKSFASFTPIGPFLVTADEIEDPHALHGSLSVNGEQRQSLATDRMIVDVWNAIEIISSVLTLQPGDVILTGTPAGVGPIAPGDTLSIAIDRIGEMTLPVVARTPVSPRTF